MNELEIQTQRLEQQISSFEKLHAGEIQRFEEQLATYRQLQRDELQMLRDQLQELKAEVAAIAAREAEAAAQNPPNEETVPVQLTITRRDLITGNIPSFSQKQE